MICGPSSVRVCRAERLEAMLIRIGHAQGLLSRIRETAVSSTRLVGFLGSTPEELAAQLSDHGLTAVGGFLPARPGRGRSPGTSASGRCRATA